MKKFIPLSVKIFILNFFNGNYIKRASNRYLLAEGVAVTGAAISLGLFQNDPVAAASILTISSIISYAIRISGHIALGKQTTKD